MQFTDSLKTTFQKSFTHKDKTTTPEKKRFFNFNKNNLIL